MHTSPARSTPSKSFPFPISPFRNFEEKTTSVMRPPTTMSLPKPTTRTMMIQRECNYVRSRLLKLWWIQDKLFKITLIVFCFYREVATSQQRSNNKVVFGRRTSSAPSAGSRSASQKTRAPSPSPSPAPSPSPSPSVVLHRLPLSAHQMLNVASASTSAPQDSLSGGCSNSPRRPSITIGKRYVFQKI